MLGTGSFAIAIFLLIFVATTVAGELPPPGPTIFRGERLPSFTAKVVSIAPITERTAYRPDGPAVTGASGLDRDGVWTFVVQDDSTDLAAISDAGRIIHLRLFESVEGRKRFHPSFGNKNQKPDIEAIVRVRARAEVVRRLGGNPGRARYAPVLLLFGSGSIRGVRDRVAIVVPRLPVSKSIVRVVTATGFYDRLRGTSELTGSVGQINLEAAASIEGMSGVRVYNRGNSGPNSVTASVDLSTHDLLDYLVECIGNPSASFRAPLRNPCVYDLGSSAGHPVSIGEAIALPAREALGGSGSILLAAIAEATTNAIDDGATSGTVLGLHLGSSGRLLVAPVMQDGKPTSLKIEGLAVRSIRSVGRGSARRVSMRVLGVVDADDPDPAVPSSLVELEVTFALN